ncbi:hypothetical protein GJ633_03995 [Halorubrum sp. CBA1125]|nr:hypothetical protein [Halorubrum sp. CBA1125]
MRTSYCNTVILAFAGYSGTQ